jgi:hypothetical protein
MIRIRRMSRLFAADSRADVHQGRLVEICLDTLTA